MSGQCTNPGPPYPVCLHPFRTSQYSFQCCGCLSWVHHRCSGLASFTLHHDMWRCSKGQTSSASPPKVKPPSPLFPSPPSIIPLMDNPLFPPRSPTLTGKEILSPSPDGKTTVSTAPFYTSTSPYWEINSLLSFRTSAPFLLHPHQYLPPIGVPRNFVWGGGPNRAACESYELYT